MYNPVLDNGVSRKRYKRKMEAEYKTDHIRDGSSDRRKMLIARDVGIGEEHHKIETAGVGY